MNRIHLLAILAVSTLAAGCTPPGAGTTPSGANSPSGTGDPQADLVAAYRTAHESKDLEAILSLCYWDGVDAEMRETVRGNWSDALLCRLMDVRIEPAEPSAHGPREEGGIRWRPSLEVVAVMTVDYDPAAHPPGSFLPTQAEYLVGEKGGRCYFTVPVRE